MKRILTACAAAVILFALAGCGSSSPAKAPEKVAVQSETPSPTQTPTAVNDLAQRTKTELLTELQVKSFTDALATSPGMLWGYIASIKSPLAGDIVITVQIDQTDTTQAALQLFARHVLTLAGEKLTDLKRVEAVTADSLLRGVMNRYSIPSLNQ